MSIENHQKDQAEADGEPFVMASAGALPGNASRRARVVAALRSESWLTRLALILIFALYFRAIGFAPVYDDNVISPWTSWHDVPKFFTHDIFGYDGSAHSVYYRPLAVTWGFTMAFCTGGAPGWLHLGAILLHLAVVVLAYVFGRHLFGDWRLALLTAVLFGLHPSKVESVAWIGSSTVDGLAAVFFFASLIAFLKWREGGAGRWMAASVALFACAMFTKETMVFIPILIAVYLWLMPPNAGRVTRILRTLAPYGVVWAVYMTIRHAVIKPAGASAEYIHPTFTLVNLWTAPASIWWYLRHLVLPWRLSVEYTATLIDRPTLVGFILPAAGIAGLLLAPWWLWRRQRSPVAAFLIVWFAVTLAPPVIVAPMVLQHDRYLYIPAYAFCALLAWVILRLGSFPAEARMAVAMGVVLLWSGLTWHEMGYWDSDLTLWTRVLQISPNHPKAQLQLAFLYREAGDTPRALRMLDDGLRERPRSPNFWLARASMLYSDQQWDEARAGYEKVMHLTEPAPGQPVEAGPPTRVRAAAAYQLALMAITAKDFPQAERYARTALSLRSDGVGYHEALAESLSGEGRLSEAWAENATELRLRVAQQRANGARSHP
jgi:4-amino-4-deoxy-L-arabinose transferase-like glycosyltransferase